jgi:hypothetical protein
MNIIKDKKLSAIIIISLLLALFLTYLDEFLFPYDIQIEDRLSYLNHATNFPDIFDGYYGSGFWFYFFNEPIFNGLFFLLDLFFSLPEDKIHIIVLLTSFISILLISMQVRNLNYFQILLCVTFPLFLTCYVQSLRLGIGLTFFLFGLFAVRSKYIKILLYGISALIHITFLLFIPLLLVSYYLKLNNIKLFNKYIFFVIIGLTFYAVLNPIFIGSLGLPIRQISLLESGTPSTSGAGFIFTLILIILVISQPILNSLSIFSIFIGIFYCAGYFTFGPIARVGEAGLIFLVMQSFNLIGVKRTAAILSIVIFSVALYVKIFSNNGFFG